MVHRLDQLQPHAIGGPDKGVFPFSVRGCPFDYLHAVGLHIGQKTLQIAGVLLTMYDVRLNLSRQVADEARSYFVNKVYKTAITRNVRLAEAPGHSQPIVLYDIISPGAQNYMSLAGEIIKHG